MRKGLFAGAFLVAVLFQFALLVAAAYCDGTRISATVVGCYLPIGRMLFAIFGIPFALGQVLPTFAGILLAMFLYASLCSAFVCLAYYFLQRMLRNQTHRHAFRFRLGCLTAWRPHPRAPAASAKPQKRS